MSDGEGGQGRRRAGQAAPPGDPVRAAGVVLLRPNSSSGPEVALIHRARRQDWSLPKGKLDPGEHTIVAAVRECEEETGIRPILGVPLPTQEYLAFGQRKTVDYWAATVGSVGEFAPNDEVDEVAWMSVDEACGRLTYPRDAELVRLAAATPATSPLILLRHASAMKRADYDGTDDARRPLTALGKDQARALVPILGAFGAESVHSSDTVRCRDTVRRYARAIGSEVHDEPALSERGYSEHPRRTAKRMLRLLCDPRPLVVCSHRPVLPTLVEVIAGLRITGPLDLEPRLPPGGFLVIHRSFGEGEEPTVLAVERHAS